MTRRFELGAWKDRCGRRLVLSLELQPAAVSIETVGESVSDDEEPSSVRPALRPLAKALPGNVVPMRRIAGGR